MIALLAHLHALSLLFWAAQGLPEEQTALERKAGQGPESRFFRMTIDFWKTGPRKDGPPPPADAALERARETIWAEPVRQPDGRYSIYVPPKAVLEFLENPTPENLKGYLDWKRARAEKLRRAMELLEEYRAKEDANKPVKGDSPESPTSQSGNDPGPAARADRPAVDPGKALAAPAPSEPRTIQVTYFHGKGCPHCTKQDRILAEWLARHPEASIRVLELGESPELWLRHRVRGTPSLLVGDGAGDGGILLEGLSEASRLDQALVELRRPRREIPKSTVPGDAPSPKEARK